MANGKSTDFLRFSAYSIKDLITRKLSESSEFTDQIYEGSNLAILIDLVSYMYQCLVFQLNNAASESMFSDTQIYENISRLVNLLGYNPNGCSPANFSAYIKLKTGVEAGTYFCYPYTRIDTNMTDKQGKKIYFSTKRDTSLKQDTMTLETGDYFQTTFYNGTWKLYSTIFTASGLENETFQLNIASDSANSKYVPSKFIDVIVQSNGRFEFWKYDSNGIFNSSPNVNDQRKPSDTTIYSNSDKMYTVKMTQDKTYEISFGNGIVGKKLAPGDKILVFYLDSNGPDGEIDLTELDFSAIELEHNASMLGVSESLYENLLLLFANETDLEDIEKLKEQSVAGKGIITASDSNLMIKFKPEENVATIRQNAPNWFKLGNRLITHKDYEYYIKNCIGIGNVVDVKCMNNTEFAATFYKWLYMQGINGQQKNLFNDSNSSYNSNGGNHYFRQEFWSRSNFKQVDPADANNTYLWICLDDNGKTTSPQLTQMLQEQTDINSMKTLTTEIEALTPIFVNFDICANTDEDTVRNSYLDSSKPLFDNDLESYIEITIDDNTIYVGSSMKQQIYNIIVNSFNVNNCKLGQNINYADILNKIYAIAGIKRVRTIFKPTDENSGLLIKTFDGLSFASWSPILNEDNAKGIDLNISNSGRNLEDFQFPTFVGKELLKDRIRIVKKSLIAVNTLKM